MAVSSRTTSFATTNLRYSAFLGMLYVSTPETEAAIKAVKNEVGGESEVKKGYSGNVGNTPSAKAIAKLREQGITSVSVNGILTSARVVSREIDGRPTPYLNVGLKDDEGRFYISVELGQSAAQMLARKLTNAAPGVPTEISMFATYGSKQGAPRAYADHGASLKQNGVEVKGVNPALTLKPLVNEAIVALEKAGITKASDKDTFNRRRSSIEIDFHVDLMNQVNEMFTAHYAQTEQMEDSQDHGASAPDQKEPF